MAQKKPSRIIAINEAKRWLRRALIRKRQLISLPRKKSLSATAVNNLVCTRLYRESKSIALFLGFASEIATDALVARAWKDGKRVLLPITSHGWGKPFLALFKKGDKLKRTSFGPMELAEKKKPFKFGSIDIVVAPGLGFDKDGYRLGYGGGVYDRILKKTSRAHHVGLFFNIQQLFFIPRTHQDHRMDMIVTETGAQFINKFHDIKFSAFN